MVSAAEGAPLLARRPGVSAAGACIDGSGFPQM
jgi:hypothetical protein